MSLLSPLSTLSSQLFTFHISLFTLHSSLFTLHFFPYFYPMIKFLFSIPQWLRLVVALLYLSIVAKLSLMPSNQLPELNPFDGFDKVVHGCMYFGLTVLACWTFQAEVKRNWILYIVVFAIFWGLLMEFSQLEMKAGRAFEWTDELANSVGALLGASIYVWIAGKYRRRESASRTRGRGDDSGRGRLGN